MRLLRSSLSWPTAPSSWSVAYSCRRLVSSSSAQGPPANLPTGPAPAIDLSFLRAPMSLSAIPEDKFETTRDGLAALAGSDEEGLSPSDLAQLAIYRKAFKRAAKLPTAADRAAYFRQVDLANRPKEKLDRDRREKAREAVANGKFTEKDALSLDEWEKGLVEREQQYEKTIREEHVEGQGSVSMGERLRILRKHYASIRRQGLLRREIRSEMKEQAKEDTGGA